MIDPEIKTCPGCGRRFACRAKGPDPCECARIQVPEEAAQALQERYDDCLCLDCLRSLAEGAPHSAPIPGPS